MGRYDRHSSKGSNIHMKSLALRVTTLALFAALLIAAVPAFAQETEELAPTDEAGAISEASIASRRVKITPSL
jgi:hypothetical protein